MKNKQIDYTNMYVKMIIAGLLGLNEKEGFTKKDIETTVKEILDELI